MSSPSRTFWHLLDAALVALVVTAVVHWLALRRGWVTPRPALFAAHVSAILLVTLARAALLAAGLWSGREPRGSGLGQLLVIAGLLTAGGGGLLNWLLGLQGAVILTELDVVPLSHSTHLQEFDSGPLADVDEMRLTLQLQELGLEAAGPGAFLPASTIRVRRSNGEVAVLVVAPGRAASYGSLRFFQGAFGFAPRIVILKDGDPVFDRVVPFITERHDRAGVSFESRFTVASEGLEVEGAVDLASLDEGMRGHAMLDLTVRREDVTLGSGRLLPGHFASIDEGYRVGFAGLEKWSEIDISRRNYGQVVVAGVALFVLGAVVSSVARWRRR